MRLTKDQIVSILMIYGSSPLGNQSSAIAILEADKRLEQYESLIKAAKAACEHYYINGVCICCGNEIVPY